MGTAGLSVPTLAKLLRLKKIECNLIEGDESRDHCVMRLTSVRRPGTVAFLEYENKGYGTRLAGLHFSEDQFPQEDCPLEWQEILELKGARKDDPGKIAEWVRPLFFTQDT